MLPQDPHMAWRLAVQLAAGTRESLPNRPSSWRSTLESAGGLCNPKRHRNRSDLSSAHITTITYASHDAAHVRSLQICSARIREMIVQSRHRRLRAERADSLGELTRIRYAMLYELVLLNSELILELQLRNSLLKLSALHRGLELHLLCWCLEPGVIGRPRLRCA